MLGEDSLTERAECKETQGHMWIPVQVMLKSGEKYAEHMLCTSETCTFALWKHSFGTFSSIICEAL